MCLFHSPIFFHCISIFSVIYASCCYHIYCLFIRSTLHFLFVAAIVGRGYAFFLFLYCGPSQHAKTKHMLIAFVSDYPDPLIAYKISKKNRGGDLLDMKFVCSFFLQNKFAHDQIMAKIFCCVYKRKTCLKSF